MSKKNDNRRSFLKKSVVASAAATIPYHLTASTSLGSTTTSKNDRMPIALIGAGGMGVANMKSAKDLVEVVAIADVDEKRMDGANKKLSEGKADTYKDYQAILERDDIKIVHIATPDHWHAKPLSLIHI